MKSFLGSNRQQVISILGGIIAFCWGAFQFFKAKQHEKDMKRLDTKIKYEEKLKNSKLKLYDNFMIDIIDYVNEESVDYLKIKKNYGKVLLSSNIEVIRYATEFLLLRGKEDTNENDVFGNLVRSLNDDINNFSEEKKGFFKRIEKKTKEYDETEKENIYKDTFEVINGINQAINEEYLFVEKFLNYVNEHAKTNLCMSDKNPNSYYRVFKSEDGEDRTFATIHLGKNTFKFHLVDVKKGEGRVNNEYKEKAEGLSFPYDDNLKRKDQYIAYYLIRGGIDLKETPESQINNDVFSILVKHIKLAISDIEKRDLNDVKTKGKNT